MRDALPNFELVTQLCSFMHSVPLLWTQHRLQNLHSVHVENRGPQESELSFELEVVENDLSTADGFLQVLVSVCDPVRVKGEVGSSWQPLTTSFLWRASGELKFPAPWEIYREAFAHVG